MGAPSPLEALLLLSRSLSASEPRGLVREAFDKILSAAGLSRGLAYVTHRGRLELVHGVGLPGSAGDGLDRLPVEASGWFVAQRAAARSGLVVEDDIARASSGRLDSVALRAAGWVKAIACPVVAGNELRAVLVLAAPEDGALGFPARPILELGCDLLGHQLLRLKLTSPPATEATPAPASVAPERRLSVPPPSGRAGVHSPPSQRERQRERELTTMARAVAATLRREGPTPSAEVLGMLQSRGATASEAISLLTFAVSTGILVREKGRASFLNAPAARPGRTVLVVDDEFDVRTILRDILDDEGYSVETAQNGVEAMRLLHGIRRPALLVLDLMMPIMDGWQLLREMRQDTSLGDIPVVVISTGQSVIHRPDLADDYLRKPLNYQQFLSAIERTSRPLH